MIPDGWPSALTQFRVNFGEDGMGVAPDDVAHYLLRMQSAGIRTTSADPGEQSTTEILNIAEELDRSRGARTFDAGTSLSELRYFSPRER